MNYKNYSIFLSAIIFVFFFPIDCKLCPLLGKCNKNAENQQAFPILDLKTDEFDSAITTNKEIIVLFTANWCASCRKVDTIFKKAVSEYKQDTKSFLIVDCQKFPDICKKNSITSFPQIKKYRNGEINHFETAFTEEIILSFIEQDFQHKLTVGNIYDNQGNLKRFPVITIVVVITSKTADDLLGSLRQTISERYFRHPVVLHKQEEKQGNPAPKIGVIHPNSTNIVFFEGELTSESLGTFLDSELTQVIEIEGNNFTSFTEMEGIKSFLVYDNPEERDSLVKAIKGSSFGHAKKYVVGSIHYGHYRPFLETLLIENNLPCLLIWDEKSNLKYILNGELSFSNAQQFFASHSNDTLRPKLKSQSGGPNEVSGTKIINLTGDSLISFISSSPIPVLVEFYTEECGYCKHLGTIVQKIALEYGKNDCCVFGMFNCNQNDVDPDCNVSVEKVPTLVLFRPGKPRQIYTGYYEYSDVKAFINSGITEEADEL